VLVPLPWSSTARGGSRACLVLLSESSTKHSLICLQITLEIANQYMFNPVA
jgi:hypothetical protein